MGAIFSKIRYGANNREDMVEFVLGELRPLVAYQTAMEVAQSIRVSCKAAARHDRAPATFWRDLVPDDAYDDTPKANRGFRRSRQVPNIDTWQVAHQGARIRVIFDGRFTEFHYEDGIKLHRAVLAAAKRAKAWAGDTSRRARMVGHLTGAEENYRLGLN